jgi:hypothetical protein
VVQTTKPACRKGEDIAYSPAHRAHKRHDHAARRTEKEDGFFRLLFMVGEFPLKMVCAGKTQRKLGFLLLLGKQSKIQWDKRSFYKSRINSLPYKNESINL